MNVTRSGSPAAATSSPPGTAAACTRWTDSTVSPRRTSTLIGGSICAGGYVPELPEVEALRRSLDDPVSATPIAKAGPAHIATLKTFDPPLRVLEGRRFTGA